MVMKRLITRTLLRFEAAAWRVDAYLADRRGDWKGRAYCSAQARECAFMEEWLT